VTDINDDMTSTQEWVPLSEEDALATEPGFYTIDNEYVVLAGIRMAHINRGPSAANRPVGRAAARGANGSTAATHSSGATLTQYYPDAPGATGGVENPLTGDLDASGQAIITDGSGMYVKAVNSDESDGGHLYLEPGFVEFAASNSDGNTTYGVISIGTSGVQLQVNSGNLILNLPTSDPEVEGAIYSDGAPSAGVPKPLMISGGPAA
jgi:hypothetical protein